MTEPIIIFDTTLRDGEQSPDATMTLDQKIELGLLLDKIGVNVIEAGFARSSSKDAEAIYQIAKQSKQAVICSLARCVKEDIEVAANALLPAIKNGRGRIHVFAPTSSLHMIKKLNKNPEEIKQMIAECVSYATTFTSDVEFSAEDSTRSHIPFLVECIKIAINSGAKTINLPDTVGYSEPEEYYQFVKDVIKAVNAPKEIIFSTHCHDDLGLAVANSLSGIKAGARQIECAVNGLGERAGNAALEEVVMAIKTRQDRFPFDTSIKTEKLCFVSQKVSDCSGFAVSKNKAVVGLNAFRHASGIHQDGVIKDRRTYEVMEPKSVGATSQIVLNCYSGEHAVSEVAKRNGFTFSKDEIHVLTLKIKEIAMKQKVIGQEMFFKLAKNLNKNVP